MIVPEGWEFKKLGSVAELQRGFDLPSSKRVDGSIPIISSGGLTGFHNEFKAKAPGVVTGRYGSIGDVFYIKEDFWPLNTALWVKDFHSNAPEFIYYMLSSFDFKKFSDKTGVPGVNRNDLHIVKVGVPPVSEQRKIAEILSTWDKAIVTTAKLIAASQQQKKALMQQLLTGKKRFAGFSEEWEKVSFGDVVLKTQLGTTERTKDSLDKNNIPLLKMGNLTWGSFNFDKLETIPRSKVDSSLFLQKGDFLFNTRNTPELVGKSAVWKGQMRDVCFDNNINRISLSSNVDSEFLCMYLTFGKGKSIINSLPAGSTSVAAIYWKDLKNIKILLPSIKEQHKIAAVLTAADQEIDALQSKLAHFKQEKKALMQQLLTGKRRVVLDSEQ